MFERSKKRSKIRFGIGMAMLLLLTVPGADAKADFDVRKEGSFIQKGSYFSGEYSLAGICLELSARSNRNAESSGTEKVSSLPKPVFPDNIAVANVSTTLNIRKGPGTGYDISGYLPKDGICYIEKVENGWALIESGGVKGYCSTEYLITGEIAKSKAKELTFLYAVVDKNLSGNLNVRSKPSADDSSKIITHVSKGESMLVSKENVADPDDPESIWVEIFLNDDTSDVTVGYVSRDYVSLNYEMPLAGIYSPYGAGVSKLRTDICDYAKKFIGTKYVWGGNDLYNGIDCSGYVKKVYEQFGYTTPRVSRDMAKACKKIGKEDLLPGDLVFYGDISENYINHVALYIGDDMIIHSSTNYKGVAISSMYFYTIISYGRFLED